jgi:hypothetical protein
MGGMTVLGMRRVLVRWSQVMVSMRVHRVLVVLGVRFRHAMRMMCVVRPVVHREVIRTTVDSHVLVQLSDVMAVVSAMSHLLVVHLTMVHLTVIHGAVGTMHGHMVTVFHAGILLARCIGEDGSGEWLGRARPGVRHEMVPNPSNAGFQPRLVK